jgi:hypothetical protein
MSDAKGQCPYCGHELSESDIVNILRPTGLVPKRQRSRRKPRAYEAMPIILKLLGESPYPISTPELRRSVQDALSQRGFEPKPLAISFGLTYLKAEGLVQQPTYGMWRITLAGKNTAMDEGAAEKLTNRLELEYRERKERRKR